jgi:hypothetical protein
MGKYLLSFYLSLFFIFPTLGAQRDYLKELDIQVPGGTSKVTVVVPNDEIERNFMPSIEESLKHAGSKNGVNEKITRRSVAYYLAGAFEEAIQKKDAETAIKYAISAILNDAHKIDDSFLYILDDTNYNLIDNVIKSTQEDKLDKGRKAWENTKKTVDALISFQESDPYRIVN